MNPGSGEKEDQGWKGGEHKPRRGISLYPCSLVREANTSWHPWSPFLIRRLKVMGRGERKRGKEGIDVGVPQNSMYKISPSLGIIRTLLFLFFPSLFFSPWVMLAHPLVLLWGAFSCGVCANPLSEKRQTPFITKVGANITCHKPNVLDRTALFWGARRHTSLISSLLLSLFFLLHSSTLLHDKWLYNMKSFSSICLSYITI